MPRKTKLEDFEPYAADSAPVAEDMKKKDEIEFEDERTRGTITAVQNTIEGAVKKRAPRKRKLEEVAAIDQKKEEILNEIKKTVPKKRTPKKVFIEDEERLIREPVTETVVPNAEKNDWMTHYGNKAQQSKEVVPQKDSAMRRIWKKIRVPFVGLGFTALGLLASKDAKATHGDPEDSLTKKEISKESKITLILPQQEMRDWNDFVDFLETKGVKGSMDLEVNGGKLGKQLMEEYKAAHPGTTVSYETVARIQKAMEGTRDNAQAFARRRNDPDADKLLNGISKVDGILGHRTSQFKFPILKQAGIQQYPEKQIGMVGAKFPNKRLPPGVDPDAERVKGADGTDYYIDPASGDLHRY